MGDPVNWPQIIRDLEERDVTLYKLALMMRCQYVQVQRWAHGVEPKYHTGAKLLAIHAQYVVSRETLQSESHEQQNNKLSA